MRDIGIDVGAHRPTSLAQVAGEHFDLVVTLCESAQEARPMFPTRPAPWATPSPTRRTLLAEEEALAEVREVRDMILAWIELEFGPEGPPAAQETEQST
jgi:protein-tyrosine-phosphatase